MKNQNSSLKYIRRTDKLLSESINSVIKKTYLLLSFCIFLSIVSGCIGMIVNYTIPFIVSILTIFGTFFYIEKNAENKIGLSLLFFLVSFLGFSIGPYLNSIMFYSQNGANIIGASLGLTCIIFLSLSSYVLITKKNFSFLEGSIMSASVVILAMIFFNIFLSISFLHLVISGFMIIFSSMSIIYSTSKMVHDQGENNPILITVSLFLSIYNLFISLLQILNFFSRD